MFAISLLGQIRITIDDKVLDDFESDKARALLVYLALNPGRPHRREQLSALFWAEQDEKRASKNLRQTLYRLRQTLDSAQACLRVTPQSIQFNAGGDYALDVETFEALIAESQHHPHDRLTTCQTCMERLAQAARLYRGDFLAGFSIKDSPAFDEWMGLQRERLRLQALDALQALADYHERRRDYAIARDYARRQLELEPWQESAHRQLMRALALEGNRATALAQYAVCRQVLADELAIEPEAETTALYEQIRAGNLRLPIADLQLLRPAAQTENRQSKIENRIDWGEAPEAKTLYGREAELAQLETWLDADRCRLVAVLGMGGIGKTALAAKAARAVADRFDFVFWRSLLNAPPLAEVLGACLQFLSSGQLATLPAGLDEQLTMLFNFLRKHRCLLVLDNIESILQAGAHDGARAGTYRPGYEAYGQLIQRMANMEHASCLLLTSRESPQEVARLEGDTPRVQSLHLSGLAVVPSQELLQMRGLAITPEETATLVQRYSGNPLALKLVAQTVHDLFESDITAFLDEETLIFDDVRAVLEQQFARLSPLEQDVLLWLAIEREGVSLHTLTQDLVQSTPRRQVVEALRALQRRSLLEKTETGVALQNVVTEFLTDTLVEQMCEEVGRSLEFDNSKFSTQNLKLNRFALLKAQSKEYVRQSQERLLLAPITLRLKRAVGSARLAQALRDLLASLDAEAAGSPQDAPGYAAANILHLMLHLGIDVRGCNFSRLNVWQAYLRGKALPEVNFAQANLAGSVFTDTFRSVNCVAFSPHAQNAGQLLAAGSGDGTIRLWNVADRQPCGVCVGHASFVYSVVFSPNGEWLASASEDGTACVWDVRAAETATDERAERGQLLHTLRGHTRWLKCVAFSPDSALLASSGGDGAVRLWDTRTWAPVRVLLGHSGGVWSVAFSPDGLHLASGSEDSTVRVWEVSTGRLLHTLRGHDGRVTEVAFSPDGALLVSSAHDGTVRIWDADAAARAATSDPIHIYRISASWINSMAFSPDGALLVCGCGDQTARIWEIGSRVEAGRPRQTFHGHTSQVEGAAFSPDGALIATSSGDHTVRLWDIRRAGQTVDILRGYCREVMSATFCLEGAALASGGLDHIVRIWDVDTERLLHAMPGHTRGVMSVAASVDGTRLASGGQDHIVRLWDAHTGQPIRELHGHMGTVTSVRFSPDGARIASSSHDHTVRMWDANSGQAIHILRLHRDAVMAVAFSPDGELLASAGRDRTIYISEVRTGRMRTALQGHTKWIKSLDFSFDGALLASGSDEDVVRLWDLESGEMIKTLHGHTNVIESVAFSPRSVDGRMLLASASYDGTVRLWDVLTGEAIHVLYGHSNWVRSVAFSPDGALLVSGSDDETVKLWDLRQTGACLRTLRAEGPYSGMNITGVTGIGAAQKAALIALGAVDGQVE